MKRILVIEDDAPGRQLYKIVLERAGYEVMEAVNGKEGCKLYRQQPCKLIITDIFMPEKEGLETILELKKEFPDVKIIAVSGGSAVGHQSGLLQADEALKVAKLAGAEQTLQKPVDIHQLVAIVDELMQDV